MKNNKKLNLQNKHFLAHWRSVTVSIATLAILVLGYKLFISGSKFEESISRKLFYSEKKISIKLSNDNIYTNGIDDILNDISKEITLPKELYVSDNFEIFLIPTEQSPLLMLYYTEKINWILIMQNLYT